MNPSISLMGAANHRCAKMLFSMNLSSHLNCTPLADLGVASSSFAQEQSPEAPELQQKQGQGAPGEYADFGVGVVQGCLLCALIQHALDALSAEVVEGAQPLDQQGQPLQQHTQAHRQIAETAAKPVEGEDSGRQRDRGSCLWAVFARQRGGA